MHPMLAGGIRGALRAHPMLGDAGLPNDDQSYTGETGDSAFSMQYYIEKARQFQVVMDSLDTAASAASDMIATALSYETSGIIPGDESMIDDLSNFLTEFDGRKYQFRLTAEAINAGAATVNGMGGRFPELSIPQGLGIAPVVMGAAALAAIATAAALISWGNTWLRGLNQRMAVAAAAAQIEDPDAKAAFLAQATIASQAADAAEESPVSTIANAVKWAAIAGAAYLTWKAFSDA